jgi:hypothetical protein
MWSFNRLKDGENITTENKIWSGPYSWPTFEKNNGLNSIPDIEGVYLFTFKFKDGFLIYAVGITNSTKRRIATHTREYKKGAYTILNIENAEKGERVEIWHGWQYAKDNPQEFEENKDFILSKLDEQLKSFRIFVLRETDKRKRERIEAALMQNIYFSKEYWSELADRGMFLKGRHNFEMPIVIKNMADHKIYGLPESLEI